MKANQSSVPFMEPTSWGRMMTFTPVFAAERFRLFLAV